MNVRILFFLYALDFEVKSGDGAFALDFREAGSENERETPAEIRF